MLQDTALWHGWVSVLACALLLALFVYALAHHTYVRTAYWRLRWMVRASLRQDLAIGLVLMSSLPLLALGLLLTERSAQLRGDRITMHIEDLAATLAQDVDQFIALNWSGIDSAAQAIARANRFDEQSLSGWLQTYHGVYHDFLTMLATNETGDIVAATARTASEPRPVADLAGQNIADRDYFRQPMLDGRVFLSQVFQGRGLGRDPIVAISAPLRDASGRLRGIVEGSLNLRAFARLESTRLFVDGATLVIVDQKQRVIYSGAGTGYRELQSLAAHPLVEGARTVLPGAGYRYADTDSEQSANMLAASSTSQAGWQVFVQLPVATIQAQARGDYIVGLTLLLLSVLLSLLLAATLMRRFTTPIELLQRTVEEFRLDHQARPMEIPASLPLEFSSIFKELTFRSRQLRTVHGRLTKSIAAGNKLQSELTRAIGLKEIEISERTAALEDANRKLEALSRRDALTGVGNRRAFEAFRERVWRLSARERKWVSVILIDIDCFKTYNDTLGHQAGDDALCLVARAIEKSAARPLDMVARYGGEEFVAVLSDTALEPALIVAERIRASVEALQIPHAASPAGVVTVSIGVAAALPMDGHASELTLQQADKALYRAKDAGRNRIMFFQDDRFLSFNNRLSAPAAASR